jgi:hypothetical protein
MTVAEANERKTLTFDKDELDVFMEESKAEGFKPRQFSIWVNRCCRQAVNLKRGNKQLDAPVA